MFNFRNRLLLLQVTIVLLMVVLLGGGSQILFVSAIERLKERQLVHLAGEGAKEIAFDLQRISQHVEGLDMESFRQRYGELPLEKHFLEYFRRLPERFPVVSLLDQQGAEVVKLVNGQPVPNYLNYQYDPVVQRARRNPNRLQIAAKLQDPQLGEPVIHLAYSYVSYFGDQFLGTLLLTIPLKELDQNLLEISKDGESSLSLVSDSGEILTYPRPEKTFQNLGFKVGTTPERHELFGEEMLLVAEPVGVGNWQVLATVPWQVFRSEVNKLRELAVIVTLLVLALGVLLAWKITALLTRQINRLVEFAERVGLGDYSQMLPLDSCEEFNRLNNAFNHMVVDLDTHRRSRDSLQKIIETVIDPLIVSNRQGLIVQINHAALELFSCESARLLNRPLADLFPEPPNVLRRNEFSSGLLRSRVDNLETWIRNCHGEEIAVLFSSAPSGSESDEFGVVCILKNVTELMAARDAREKALIQAEEARRRIDVMLRSVPDGLVVTDSQGDILLMNMPAEKMLGDEAERRVRELAIQLLDESGATQRSIDIPLARNGHGGLRVIQANASEVRDVQGGVSGLVMLLRDVSHERTMAQMKNEFISTAAHELRTPLTSILGYSELLLEPANRERFSAKEQRDFLQEILSRAETLARIVDDLLSISRIESGQPLSLEISPTDISAVIERVVQQFRLTANTHRYELNLPGNKRLVPVDSGRLQQVLENLLSNAVKYSANDSLVRVRSEDHEDTYRIVIEDQGIGMTPEQVARVFDKFYRVDYSNTKTSGLGIGMSIVKQIIEGHGGTITLSSGPGSGTRVEVNLPLVR